MENTDDLRKATRDGGCLVILAILESGPQAGGPVASVCTREEFVRLIRDVTAKRNMERGRIIKSIKDCIRQAVAQMPKGDLEKSAMMDDLCQDLILLLAAKLATKSGDDFLEGTGLMSLHLWIDEDESLPWDKRGMLNPALVKELNLDDRAAIIG